MAATTTGTPAVVVWAAGINPAAQNITVPADCTAVYAFWSFYTNSNVALASITLDGNAPDQSVEFPVNIGPGSSATGLAVWYNPATGTRSLDVAWDAVPAEGPTTIVAFVKDGDTTAWRDADATATASSTDCSVTLTTESGDLVLKYDQKYQAIPANTSGWTSLQTQSVNNDEGARLASIVATGTTQVCPSEGENFSSIAAVAIPAGTTAEPRGGSPQSIASLTAVRRAAFH